MRRTGGSAKWHETEPGCSAAVAWRGRFRGTGDRPAKAEKYSAEKTQLGKVRRRSGVGNSNAASTGPGHRDEFRDSRSAASPVIARSTCDDAIQSCKYQAGFDCAAKPVIRRMRWLDSPAPHSVNRGSDEMHRPTGRRSRRPKTRNDNPGRIAQRESVPFTRERSKVRSLVRPPVYILEFQIDRAVIVAVRPRPRSESHVRREPFAIGTFLSFLPVYWNPQ
jgi:hypothetical protein